MFAQTFHNYSIASIERPQLLDYSFNTGSLEAIWYTVCTMVRVLAYIYLPTHLHTLQLRSCKADLQAIHLHEQLTQHPFRNP